MNIFYGNILLGNIITNRSITIDEALEIIDIDMDKYARDNNWGDWDWESLRMEIA